MIVLADRWSHRDLGATTDQTVVISEMTQLEDALLAITGNRPTYMRPPYLSTSPASLATLATLGYHVIQIDIDTYDWQNTSPATIGDSVTRYQAGIDAGGTISLSHDPLVNTVNTLAQAMIDKIKAKGLTCKQTCLEFRLPVAYSEQLFVLVNASETQKPTGILLRRVARSCPLPLRQLRLPRSPLLLHRQ
jgi:peptidoglycan/xylan/chitin deacetylase (PgdA/CDA1 family)